MALKIESGFTDNFNLRMEGNWLIISYRGKEWQRQNIKLNDVMLKDYQVYVGELQGKTEEIEVEEGTEKVSISQSEVTKFAQAYQGLQKKYTGRFSTYVAPGPASKDSTKRNWQALTLAAAQAKKNGLDAHDYLSMLISHYSRRSSRDGAQVSFPFPNQLHGDWAQQVIVEESGRRHAKDIPADIRASKLAGTNRYLSMDKDQAYIECYQRVKESKHNRFDIEYIKARQTQLLGQPKDWVLKREKELDAAEKAAAKGKEKDESEE